MDVKERGNYLIEVGLSKKDIESLTMGDHMIPFRGILAGEQSINIHAFQNQNVMDYLVPKIQRMPAKVTYAKPLGPPYTSEQDAETVRKRDVIYAKGLGKGDVDVYMKIITAMAIKPDGIVEANAKIPQFLKKFPENNVRIFVKKPF
jgi:hypothetical protein